MVDERMQAVLEQAARNRLPERARRRAIRVAAGLRAKDVAEAIGTSPANVVHWETLGDPRLNTPARSAYVEFLALLEERFGASSE